MSKYIKFNYMFNRFKGVKMQNNYNIVIIKKVKNF